MPGERVLARQACEASGSRRSPVMCTVCAQPLRTSMKIKPIAIRMVMRRDKVHVIVGGKEAHHLLKLTGQIEIIVLRKIDSLCIALFEQNFDLLGERSAISCPVESH